MNAQFEHNNSQIARMYVCVRVCKFIIGRLIQFGGEQTGEYSLCIATLRNTYYLSQ